MKSADKTTLATNLQRAIVEQGRSVRGLAIDAGLLPDAVRNVLRGLSKHPNPDSVAAIARVLSIPVDVLVGDEPWPAAAAAPKPPALPTRKRAAPRTGLLSLPEYELQPGGPSEIAGRVAVARWSMPSDAIGAHGLGGDLAIVRAPSRLGDIGVGDRLLVDLVDFARMPSPPGLVVIHDGVGHVLARVGMSGPGKVSVDIGQGRPRTAPVDTVDIAARVLGRWTWL